MNSRSHRSWREPRIPFRSIGEIYLGSEMFSEDDEAAKTIGEAAVGQDAVKIIENRRKVKGRLSELGKAELEKVVAKVKRLFQDSEVKAAWDIHCGCSMCPCSPGYRIKVKAQRIHSSSDKSRFNLHIVSKEYGKAVEEGREQFSLEGRILLASYAKYLIEYLSPRFEKAKK